VGVCVRERDAYGFSVAAVGGVTALCSDLFELVFGEIGKVGGVGGSHVAMGWLEGGPCGGGVSKSSRERNEDGCAPLSPPF